MKRKRGQATLYWILLAEAVGALSALLSREGMQRFQATALQPALSPPGFLFPIVWTLLYALMGVGAARVWLAPASPMRSRALALFFAQLFFNFFWSLLFFNLEAFGLALVWLLLLWVLILCMILAFSRVDRPALLQLPYLVWVSFAIFLNFAVWRLNG